MNPADTWDTIHTLAADLKSLCVALCKTMISRLVWSGPGERLGNQSQSHDAHACMFCRWPSGVGPVAALARGPHTTITRSHRALCLKVLASFRRAPGCRRRRRCGGLARLYNWRCGGGGPGAYNRETVASASLNVAESAWVMPESGRLSCRLRRCLLFQGRDLCIGVCTCRLSQT